MTSSLIFYVVLTIPPVTNSRVSQTISWTPVTRVWREQASPAEEPEVSRADSTTIVAHYRDKYYSGYNPIRTVFPFRVRMAYS